MNPRRYEAADLPSRLVPADVAAVYVGAQSVDIFKREVAAGKWPGPHPLTADRRSPCWDLLALDARIDRGSGFMPKIDDEKARLDRGLGVGVRGSS
jgi:hypothetical protein